MIPDDAFTSEKVYYHGVHVVLNFHKDYVVYIKDDQADVDPYHDVEDMEYVRSDDKRERHWKMVFEINDGGVDDEKVI